MHVGEGRSTLEEALVTADPAVSAAIFARPLSRESDSPVMKAVAALRSPFGGHAVKKAD